MLGYPNNLYLLQYLEFSPLIVHALTVAFGRTIIGWPEKTKCKAHRYIYGATKR